MSESTAPHCIYPMDDIIFVFGSNLAGIHGAGAARHALMYWNATKGWSIGRQGYSYAIPTKDKILITLPLRLIKPHVFDFIAYARSHSKLDFQVTRIGCGLAGYKDEDIAPMFRDAPANVHLPLGWRELAETMV